MKKLIVLFFALSFSASIYSQDATSENPNMNIGIGMGMDYGGFGGRFTYLPQQKFGLFAALGYNLVGVGFNAGAIYRFDSDKKVTPYIGAMYGYNAVLRVDGGTESDEIYYGPSFSLGIELKSRKNNSNFWNLEIVLPIRPSSFQDDIDRLKDFGYDVTEPLPVGFSIGYHFGLK
ncbi:MAG: hypothetical protein OEU76_10345 [Cyclobacteriaceae bacterium]|nr:hypothetical protein [Cyclobacteriaceae bacterium]